MSLEKFLSDTWAVFSQTPVATTVVFITVFVSGFSLGRYLSNSRIGDLEERVRLRDDQLANKLATTPPEQALEMIRALEGRVSDLHVRRLTAQQRSAIETVCNRKGEDPFSIQIYQDGIGSDGLLADMLALFAKLPGWTLGTGFQITDAPPTRTGLVVNVADVGHPTTAEALVTSAFRTAGLDFEVREAPERSSDVELLISSVYTG